MHFGFDCSRHGLTPASCGMTIFYGGQAHVFDNVQPNKVRSLIIQEGSLLSEIRPEINFYLLP